MKIESVVVLAREILAFEKGMIKIEYGKRKSYSVATANARQESLASLINPVIFKEVMILGKEGQFSHSVLDVSLAPRLIGKNTAWAAEWLALEVGKWRLLHADGNEINATPAELQAIPLIEE